MIIKNSNREVDNLDNDELLHHKNERLGYFVRLCNRMKQTQRFELEIRRLWRCIPNKALAVQVIMNTRFHITLNSEEALEMAEWIYAFFCKKEVRKPVSSEEKIALWQQQRGICPYCGKRMSMDMKQNHADHIIPFTYVGDELVGNLRLLHKSCNLLKGSTVEAPAHTVANIS